jgi:hypothetical protein
VEHGRFTQLRGGETLAPARGAESERRARAEPAHERTAHEPRGPGDDRLHAGEKGTGIPQDARPLGRAKARYGQNWRTSFTVTLEIVAPSVTLTVAVVG